MTTQKEIACESLDGYVRNGPSYWPCARYFCLVSLSEEGETDGGGADICRVCVSTVAEQAIEVMDGVARVDFRTIPKIGTPYSAIVVCGAAAAYDITGVEDTYANNYNGECTYCAQCGNQIV